jgi:hypothetical protein
MVDRFVTQVNPTVTTGNLGPIPANPYAVDRQERGGND